MACSDRKSGVLRLATSPPSPRGAEAPAPPVRLALANITIPTALFCCTSYLLPSQIVSNLNAKLWLLVPDCQLRRRLAAAIMQPSKSCCTLAAQPALREPQASKGKLSQRRQRLIAPARRRRRAAIRAQARRDALRGAALDRCLVGGSPPPPPPPPLCASRRFWSNFPFPRLLPFCLSLTSRGWSGATLWYTTAQVAPPRWAV